MELSGPCKACGALLTEHSTAGASYFWFTHQFGVKKREMTIDKNKVVEWTKRGSNLVDELSVEFHMHHIHREAS